MSNRDNTILVLENAGEAIPHLLSYSIDSSYTALTDAFSARLYSDDFELLREQTSPLQPVIWFVNDHRQCTGRIESQTIDNDGVIEIHGRDYLASIGDSFLDAVTIPKGTPVKDAILKVLKPFGIRRIETKGFNAVRDEMCGATPYSGAPPVDIDSLKCEQIKSNPNEGVFDFCKRILKRHGLLIQPGTLRETIALSAPEYRSQPLWTFTRGIKDSSNNTILSGSVTRDYSDVPTVLISSARVAGGVSKKSNAPNVYGTKNTSKIYSSIYVEYPAFGPKSPSSLGKVQEVQDIAFGSGGKVSIERWNPKKSAGGNPNLVYKPVYIKDTESKSQKELEKFVKRELANKLRNTLQVEYELDGHSDFANGKIYTVDCMAQVQDEVAGVFEKLWIERRSFNYSENSGPTTSVTLWRPASFEI